MTVFMRFDSHQKQRGASAILSIGIVFVSIALCAFSVDMAYFYTQQNRMTIIADSAAGAAIHSLYNSSASSFSTREDEAIEAATDFVEANSDWTLDEDDIEIGYIDPATRTYNSGTFATPSATSYTDTGGFNAVRVRLRAATGATNAPVSPLFSKFFGRNSMNVEAVSMAMYTTGISAVQGAAPFFVCDDAWEQVSALGGDPSTVTVRFYYDRIDIISGGVTTTLSGASACGGQGLNFASFGGGSVSADAMRDQIEDGYSSWVNVGSTYSLDTGNHLTNAMTSSFDAIIGERVMATTYSGISSGSATVNGVTAFVLDGYQVTGSVSNRYLEGHFEGAVACGSDCQIGGASTSNNDSTAKIVFAH